MLREIKKIKEVKEAKCLSDVKFRNLTRSSVFK